MYNSYKAFTCMEPTHFRSSLPQGYSPNCRGHMEAHGAMFPRLTAGLFPVMPAFLLPSDLVGTLTAVHEKVPTHRRLLRCLIVFDV